MAKLEDVLPALRAGQRVKRAEWLNDRLALGTMINETALLADDWEIVYPPRMLADVLPAFLAGKLIRRREWGAGATGIDRFTSGGMNTVDMQATDWEIVE